MRKQIEAAQARKDKAIAAIYAVVPNNQTPFCDCLAVASDSLKAAYEAACTKLDDLERTAISKGRAYRSRASSSLLLWYR